MLAAQRLFLKSKQFRLCKDKSGAFDSQPVSTFSYLNDLPLMIHTRFEKCRVVLVVCRLSYHKCKHGVMFTRQRNV